MQDLCPFAIRELDGFSADDSSNVGTALLDKFGRSRTAGNATNVEDEVVFGEPMWSKGGSMRSVLARFVNERDVLPHARNPCQPSTLRIGLNQVFPFTGEWDFKDHTDNTIVVILNLAVEGQVAVNPSWLQLFNDRRPFESDILRCCVLKCLCQAARTEDLVQLRKLDFLAGVESMRTRTEPSRDGVVGRVADRRVSG